MIDEAVALKRAEKVNKTSRQNLISVPIEAFTYNWDSKTLSADCSDLYSYFEKGPSETPFRSASHLPEHFLIRGKAEIMFYFCKGLRDAEGEIIKYVYKSLVGDFHVNIFND